MPGVTEASEARNAERRFPARQNISHSAKMKRGKNLSISANLPVETDKAMAAQNVDGCNALPSDQE
jgi:hypothetical protein